MVRKVILVQNSFQVLVDIDRVIELQQENLSEDEEDDIDDDELDLEDMLQTDTSDAFCNPQNIQINNTGVNVQSENIGIDDDYDIGI